MTTNVSPPRSSKVTLVVTAPGLAAFVIGCSRARRARHFCDRPAQALQAALASAATFAAGAAIPLLTTAAAPAANLSLFVAFASLVCLACLGALAARAGGAPLLTGALRVAIWGAFCDGCHGRSRVDLWRRDLTMSDATVDRMREATIAPVVSVRTRIADR
jgi:VIT family